MTGRTNSRGFTVLELMVVVAIIGIIAALAVPSYRNIMFRAKRARMLHYLQMIGNDELLYQRDHGTYYPEGWSFWGWTYAFKLYEPGDTMVLEGQNIKLHPGTRLYWYYIYRFEPYYPEPIIYAYAATFLGNDPDGDSFPDLWIKVGSGQPQPYYDDRTNTWNPVSFR